MQPVDPSWVDAVLFCVVIYLGVGAVAAIGFLAFGVGQLDQAAKGASPLFRPVIFFGCVLLWPFVVLRWLSGRKINQPIAEEL